MFELWSCWGHCLQGQMSGQGICTRGQLAVRLGVMHTEDLGQVGVNILTLPFTCFPDLVYTLISLSFCEFPLENGNDIYPCRLIVKV